MLNSISISREGQIRTALEITEFDRILKDPEAFLWVDYSGRETADFETILADVFGFHHLSIEDALVETHIPKMDDWGDYIYLVMRSVSVGKWNPLEIQTPELDLFMGANFIVTYHANPLGAVDTVWQLCLKDPRHIKKGSANILYRLADEMVNDHMPVMEQIDGIINQIEDEIFDHPKPAMLNQIFGLKRALLKLRRTLLPQREMLNKLARGDSELIQDHDRVYFRDVYDHMVRLQEINESLRDLVTGSLDIYLSVVNNRMNEVVKTLTIITTVFMPLTFLTGFFGMNFFHAVIPLETWTGKLAFGLVLGSLVFIPAGMYWWMRRRTWM
ncbi:MAG: magnesium/cobalt transporter CorA [Anaerolineae bacterium]|nr:magnesium/cobalt transporter CorA [Anaerolineae bacterium]